MLIASADPSPNFYTTKRLTTHRLFVSSKVKNEAVQEPSLHIQSAIDRNNRTRDIGRSVVEKTRHDVGDFL